MRYAGVHDIKWCPGLWRTSTICKSLNGKEIACHGTRCCVVLTKGIIDPHLFPLMPTTFQSRERPVKKVRVDPSTPGRSAGISSDAGKGQIPPKGSDKSEQKFVGAVPTLPFTFKVVAGSYEKLLYGLEGSVVPAPTGLTFHLKPIFIFPAHVSCIKAVAASPHGGKWLATGSADEIVKVWDLRRRKEIGGLMHHEGILPPGHFGSIFI
jgi:WD40 repeat protein